VAGKPAAAPGGAPAATGPAPVSREPGAADATPAPTRPALPARRPASGASAGGFQLKLSSPEIDLSPSRAIDDRGRAQLRERLLMLDADDQVATMLSMRNSLRQLEARVAELQLKLATLPAAVGPAAQAPLPATPATPTPSAGTTAPSATPTPSAATTAPSATPTPSAATTAPATVLPSVAVPIPAAADPAPAPAAAPQPVAPRAVANPPRSRPEGLPQWLWWVGAVLAVLVAGALLAWLRRASAVREESADAEATGGDLPAGFHEEIAPPSTPVDSDPEVLASPVFASDSQLTTRLPARNADELRRRYIEERFPEVATGIIVLGDADSVVKGARLFYEDGALARAVELLQFAIEAHPEEVKSWLALFEVFRLERLAGEFDALARRFRAAHGATPHWSKVQYFGREIDPDNALYEVEAPKGPRGRGREGSGAPVVAEEFDALAENWLNAPMSYANAALASELHRVLMQHAGLTEEDLIPNPVSALRAVETFTVA
jgi:pilus assembly protein FimV